jgi:subtilase family serine protease
VSHATQAVIDHSIGGVGTPGSQSVYPGSTTTYVMTATGPGGTTTASATVAVSPSVPDLVVESIAFLPSPPLQNRDNQVRTSIRNVGTGAAGPFSWEWQPGSATPLVGHVPGGLPAGHITGVSATWNPASWYGNLPTVARVDIGNAVAESNEGNNGRQLNPQVVRA